VLKSQGHFLRGPESNAIKDAVKSILECAKRLIVVKASNRLVEKFQFTTPQGLEVCNWLADHMLSHYTSTFASNNLNSLLKVSKISSDDLFKLHHKYCLSTSVLGQSSLDTDKLGNKVYLERAVKSLQNDPRARTIKWQLNNYRDPDVTGLNLLGAQNQMEVGFAKEYWKWGFVILFWLISAYLVIWAIINMKDLNYSMTTRSVTKYGVHLSLDGASWSHVSGSDCYGGPCVFDSSILTSRPDDVVTNIFPHVSEARYIKIVPVTWEGMHEDVSSDHNHGAGGEMRLGIIGDGGNGNLDYRVLLDSIADQAWLQYGCNLHNGKTKDVEGRWASQDEKIGEVQCCIASPR